MSQDVALIKQQDLALLENIKKQMAGSAFLAAADMDESLSDGIGSSYGIIHYRGKVWSLSHRQQNYIFTRPDDGSPASYIDVVILRQARAKSKSFYEGFDQDSAGKRPICSSIDGVQPDPDTQTPQSNACAICPRNQWKTDQTGRKSKDCSDYKRVAVLMIPTVSARMFNGVPLMEPVFLRVPAASLSDLSAYGDQLRQMGLPYFGMVTRISFDPTKAHPQMQFRPLQGLTKAEEPVVLPLREDATTKRIVGDDQVSRPAPALLQGSQRVDTGFAPAPAPVAPQPQPIIVPQPVYAPPAQSNGFTVAPPPAAQPIIIEHQPSAFAPPQTNFGQPAAPVTATVTATPATDVGKPEEADADIDARIAQLLPQV